MRFLRIPATFGAVVFAFGSFTVAPTRARANDIPVAFNSRAVVPLSFAATAVSFTVTRWATGMGEHSWLCSVGLRDEHEGLGGDIAWSPKHVLGEDEGEGGWRHHHDDDGEDDDGGHHQTPVPEPSTGFLVFSGIAALAGWRLRRRATAKVG
jgi:hypothetical protein